MAGNPLLRALASTLSFGAGAIIGSQTTLRVNAQANPHPMPHQLAGLLDHPLRLRYRNPAETLGLFGFAAGMTVLDLGCGTGVFTEEMARMVGPTGTVHGVDMQTHLLEEARARLLEAGFADRCVLHHSGAYSLPIEDASVDLAVLIATLGEIPDKVHALLELHRIVKPGGRLAVSEELLHPAYMASGAVRSLAQEAGFSFAGKTGNPFCYHMIFVRPA